MNSAFAEENNIRNKRYWHRTCLAILVAFLTVYALILPAITLEKHGCQLEEHIHDQECFAQVQDAVQALRDCSPHIHEDLCFDEEGEFLCGYADFFVHEHDLTCFDAEGTLLCKLPELKTHIHTEECLSEPAAAVAEVHSHEAACYVLERGELLCQEVEAAAHSHGEDCFSESSRLLCELPEEEGHSHAELCFDAAGELLCQLEEWEGYSHTDACFAVLSEQSCTLEESGGHQHADACYAQVESLICGFAEEEAEVYSEETEEIIEALGEEESSAADAENEAAFASAEAEVICGEEEIRLHYHEADCWDAEGNLICTELEILEHTHGESCFYEVETPLDADILSCGLAESEEHEHSEICFGVWTLFCQQPEHRHTEECEAPGALSKEEEAEIEEVIQLIDALPAADELEEKLLSYQEAEEWDAYQSYWADSLSQVQEAFAAYDALDENQKAYIDNASKLMELEALRAADSTPPDLSEELLPGTLEASANILGAEMALGAEALPTEVSLSIPVELSCGNAKNSSSFTIDVAEVTKAADGSWALGESLQSLTMTVKDGKPASAELLLRYPAGSSGTFYYQISQKQDSSYIRYDERFYILEVLLTEGSLETPADASVQNIWENGTELFSDLSEGIAFVNQKLSSLTVTKALSGISGVTDPFRFEALIVDADGDPIYLPQPPETAGYYAEGNCIYFDLCDGESISIENIPAGASVTVTEAEYEEYIAYYKLGEAGDLVCSNSVTITDLAEDTATAVHFINNSGYTLPETGGKGTLIYSLGGSLVLLLSGSILLCSITLRRREDREPS